MAVRAKPRTRERDLALSAYPPALWENERLNSGVSGAALEPLQVLGEIRPSSGFFWDLVAAVISLAFCGLAPPSPVPHTSLPLPFLASPPFSSLFLSSCPVPFFCLKKNLKNLSYTYLLICSCVCTHIEVRGHESVLFLFTMNHIIRFSCRHLYLWESVAFFLILSRRGLAVWPRPSWHLLCSPGWPHRRPLNSAFKCQDSFFRGPHFVALAGLELTEIQPLPSKCWACR